VSDSHLNVDVRDDLIVVTEEGLYAIYSKPEGGQPSIMARRVPEGEHEFKARAWGAACAKARELGWIV
jgi:hypothetical protein